MRLRRQNRLRRASDFDPSRKNAPKADCAAFIIYMTRSDNVGGAFSRLGVVASRRVGDAVRRNKLKRRFREIFREAQGLLPFPADILIFTRKAALGFEFAELKARFLKACATLAARIEKSTPAPESKTTDE